MRILIVDDEIQILEMLKRILRNYDVTTRLDAMDAIDSFKENTFDIVLSDFNLGGMNGITMFKEIKEMAPNTICILMSGDYVYDLEPADYFIKKPFNMDDILLTINETRR